MTNNKEDWRCYLELYGSDFARWPIKLSEHEQQQVKVLPEYEAERDLDRMMDCCEWPQHSANLCQATMDRINMLEQNGHSANIFPPMFVIIRQSALMMSCLILFLYLGFTSGSYYTSGSQEEAPYDYYSLGPAYTYASTTGDVDGW